jgi:pyrimidine-nucleoside phosphorylase
MTNMDQPLGKAVGNSLENIESIETLKGRGPQDILEVTYALGSAMLVAAKTVSNYEDAKKILEKKLKDGSALRIFSNFIKFQKGDDRVIDDYSLFGTTEFKASLTAWKKGTIEKINAFEVGMSAIDIGAGRRKKEDDIDHRAGFIFNKNVGDKVEKGESVLDIHTNKKNVMDFVKQRLKDAITISDKTVKKPEMIFKIID